MSITLLPQGAPHAQSGSFIERLVTQQQRLERWEPQPMAPGNLLRLSDIRSPDELSIDRAERVVVERGDLCPIESETYLCHPTNSLLSHHSLTLKRLHCRDRQTFDTKFFECDQLRRFATGCLSSKEYSLPDEEVRVHVGHPCIVTLHAFWGEEAPKTHPYIYKTVVLLLERPAQGSVTSILPQLGPVAPRPPTAGMPEQSEKALLGWAGSLLRALVAFHGGGIVHGGVSPGNIFLGLDNSVLLGPPCRAELEGALRTAREASRLMVGAAIPTIIMYWAPELLAPPTPDSQGRLASFCSQEVDIWALGVTLYELAARRHAFPVGNEALFREAVLAGDLDLEPLGQYPVYGTLVKNLVRVIPRNRWSAAQALLFVQHYFAIPIQRRWRAFHIRQDYKVVRQAAVLIQATYRRFYCQTHFQKLVGQQREVFATGIQSAFRAFEVRKLLLPRWSAALRLISWARRVGAAATRRRHLKAVLAIQSFAKMLHWHSWRQQVQRHQAILRTQCADIRRRMLSMELVASETTHLFGGDINNIPIAVRQYMSIEEHELTHATVREMDATHDRSVETITGNDTVLPRLVDLSARAQRLEHERETAEAALIESQQQLVRFQEKKRGIKRLITGKDTTQEAQANFLATRFYSEYKSAVALLQEQFKQKMAVASDAGLLKLRIASELYGPGKDSAYDEWERAHDPGNRIETLLGPASSSSSIPPPLSPSPPGSTGAVTIPEYRRLSPLVCVTLMGRDGSKPTTCLLTAIEITCGSCPPREVTVSVLNADDGLFVAVGTFQLEDTQTPQTFELTGGKDQAVAGALARASVVKLQFKGNHRGGNISALRQISMRGVETLRLLEGQ